MRGFLIAIWDLKIPARHRRTGIFYLCYWAGAGAGAACCCWAGAAVP